MNFDYYTHFLPHIFISGNESSDSELLNNSDEVFIEEIRKVNVDSSDFDFMVRSWGLKNLIEKDER